MAKFNITTEELKKSSTELEDKVSRYTGEFNKLYAEISNLKVEFRGQTSDTFNARIEGYRPAFEELGKTVNTYISFLNETAQKFESVEEALMQSASKLATKN